MEVQCSGFSAFTAQQGSIPGPGAKILEAEVWQKKKKERERVKKWIDGLYQGFQLLILKTGIEEKNMHLSSLNLNKSQDKLIDLVNDKSPLQSIPVNQCGKKSNIGKIAIL